MFEVLYDYNTPGKASPGLFLVQGVLGQADTRPGVAVHERRIDGPWKANSFHLTPTCGHGKMKLARWKNSPNELVRRKNSPEEMEDKWL